MFPAAFVLPEKFATVEASTELPALAPSGKEALRLLDDPHEWSAFSRVCGPDPALWESSVVIEGMHCAACSLTVEEALGRVPGVVSAQVSAGSHRARVVWSALPGGCRPSLIAATAQYQQTMCLPASVARLKPEKPSGAGWLQAYA